MVRIIFSLFLIYVFPFSVLVGQSNLQIGAKVGVVYSSFSAKEDFKPFYKGGIRPSLNFDVVYAISNQIFLQTGLGYQHAVQQRLNFKNDFIGVQIPILIGLDMKGSEKFPKLYPYILAGGEVNYILEVLHFEDGERESASKFTDPWQAGVLIGGGIKRNLKNDQQVLISAYSRLGLTGFPAARSIPLLPKIWPFQIGISFGWRWKVGNKEESKKDKS